MRQQSSKGANNKSLDYDNACLTKLKLLVINV